MARALQRALSCASDPVLRQIWIEDCQPDPDATRYRVAIAPIDPSLPLAGETLTALDRSRGWLRTELAHTLRRRGVPALRFTWADPEGTP